MAGIVEFAADSFMDAWWKDLKPDLSNTQEIDCVPLQEIIDDNFGNKPMHFDFFSLDVEGAEDKVLHSIDWGKISFGVLFLEADGHNLDKNTAIRLFLEKKGYSFLDSWHGSDWYVNKDFDQIYGHLPIRSYPKQN